MCFHSFTSLYTESWTCLFIFFSQESNWKNWNWYSQQEYVRAFAHISCLCVMSVFSLLSSVLSVPGTIFLQRLWGQDCKKGEKKLSTLLNTSPTSSFMHINVSDESYICIRGQSILFIHCCVNCRFLYLYFFLHFHWRGSHATCKRDTEHRNIINFFWQTM